jgi:hypothetical protein
MLDDRGVVFRNCRFGNLTLQRNGNTAGFGLQFRAQVALLLRDHHGHEDAQSDHRNGPRK